jgi:hypothetical protein
MRRCRPADLGFRPWREQETRVVSEKYLRPMLDYGSSRVFNCNDRARKLASEKLENPHFFKLPKMHGLIIVKETVIDPSKRAKNGPIVGTKLYIPYNQDNVYEGGRTVFFHDPKLLEVLNDLFGLRGSGIEEADIKHDLKILGVLDRLPSLDGFLMRDALELDGVVANDQYFEISDSERAVIHEFVRSKFEPLVLKACGDQSGATGKVDQLIDKVWEAKDKDALAPLIHAFRFPDEEALSLFASWKGINFYTFEYLRAKPQREQFALWLRDNSTPRNFVSKRDLDYLKQQRRSATEGFRENWNTLETISREYETLYARFLTTPSGVADFIAFLRRSREIYWRMGDALSRINHSIHCWSITMKSYPDRQLPADKLSNLFEMLQLVLVSGERVDSAVVWQ